MVEHYKNLSLDNIVEEIDGIVYTEEWKTIPGYPEFFLISSFGRVKRLKEIIDFSRTNCVRKHYTKIKETILYQGLNKKGYPRVDLCWDKQKLCRTGHRLVALAFIGLAPKGKNQVNHKKPIKTHNHYTNLEWCNNSENQFHANKNNLRRIPRRGSHKMAKLVLNLEIGIFYDSAKCAHIATGLPVRYDTFAHQVKDRKTAFIYA